MNCEITCVVAAMDDVREEAWQDEPMLRNSEKLRELVSVIFLVAYLER